MRNRSLHDSLKVFAEAAAGALARTATDGAGVPFEIDEEQGAGAILYSYRPLTAEFIESTAGRLEQLDAYTIAIEELAALEGIPAYLTVCCIDSIPVDSHERAAAAVLAFSKRLWEEDSSFGFDPERFERCFAELETTVFSTEVGLQILVPLLGMGPIGRRLELREGLAIANSDTLDLPRHAVWQGDHGSAVGTPPVLAELAIRDLAEQVRPAVAARSRFRRLLTALRLFREGTIALAPIAYTRAGDGPWQPLALGFSGGMSDDGYWLDDAELDEFGEFAQLIERKVGRDRGPLGWALGRFEMGYERAVAAEALTDHLLALRVLCDSGAIELGLPSGNVPYRVAALAADSGDRRHVAESVERAMELERYLIRGDADAGFLKDAGIGSASELATEIENHLRTILRDALIGALGADLKGEADRRLLAEPALREQVSADSQPRERTPARLSA